MAEPGRHVCCHSAHWTCSDSIASCLICECDATVVCIGLPHSYDEHTLAVLKLRRKYLAPMHSDLLATLNKLTDLLVARSTPAALTKVWYRQQRGTHSLRAYHVPGLCPCMRGARHAARLCRDRALSALSPGWRRALPHIKITHQTTITVVCPCGSLGCSAGRSDPGAGAAGGGREAAHGDARR